MKRFFLGVAAACCLSCATVKTAGAWKEGGGWKLVWADEFDKDGAPDPAKWGYEKGLVRNGELQYYTEARLENARVEQGRLVIEARKEAWEKSAYTSASLHTKGMSAWTYGRVEVMAKLPQGRGMWPAAWMLGANIGEVGWPMCGEIDIMENVGYDLHKAHFNVHTKAFNHSIGTGKGISVPLQDPHLQFHSYAMEWSASKIDFFLDHKKVFTFRNDRQGVEHWPFDKPQYLILNSAVGGGWGGQKGVDDSVFPTRYEIDYVRVWQKS